MLTAQTIDVFKGIRFRADEPFLKISMDDTGTFGRFHALSEGPSTTLIFSGRQEGPQIQDAVRSLDDLIQAAFRNAQLLQEFCFLFFIQTAEFLFDLCAYRHNVTVFCCGKRLDFLIQRVAFRIHDVFIAHVGHIDDRFERQ